MLKMDNVIGFVSSPCTNMYLLTNIFISRNDNVDNDEHVNKI